MAIFFKKLFTTVSLLYPMCQSGCLCDPICLLLSVPPSVCLPLHALYDTVPSLMHGQYGCQSAVENMIDLTLY